MSAANRRGQGGSSVALVLGLACFPLCPRANIPYSLPSGKTETSLFKWEKNWAEMALPGIRHCISTILDRSALGKGDAGGNPHPPGLNLGFGHRQPRPEQT